MPVAAGMYYSASELGKQGSLPLILIHGAGGNYMGWHNHIRRMNGWNVYAVDLPGHGKSGGEGRQSISAYAGIILQFMHELGFYQAALVGHSMGAMIALETAVQQPNQIPCLVLVSSAAFCPLPDQVIQGLLNPLTRPKSMNWLFEHLAGGDDDTRWVESTLKTLLQTRQGVLYGDLMACQSADLFPQLGKISARTLICYGEKDAFFTPQASRQMAKHILAAQSISFANTGHLLPLVRPDELTDSIQRFLAESCHNP